jgi:hypothetical protein
MRLEMKLSHRASENADFGILPFHIRRGLDANVQFPSGDDNEYGPLDFSEMGLVSCGAFRVFLTFQDHM